MVRSWPLLKEILESIEQGRFDKLLTTYGYDIEPDELSDAKLVDFQKSHSEDKYKLICHIELLLDSGLIRGIELTTYDIDESLNNLRSKRPRLSMAGFDLLDAMRNEKLWPKVKSTIKTVGVDMSLTALKTAIDVLTRQAIAGAAG